MLAKIANFIWGDWLVFLIIVTGLHYTYRLKGIQVRKFSYIFKKTFFPKESSENNNKITSLQALKTSLGSCIGNGNIVGVATAVMFGGPGALFWMWVAAIIGMAVKYGEIFFGISYREKGSNGEYSGGPMYYISKGLNIKFLGILYAFLLLIQNSGGTLIQGNVIKDVLQTFLSFSPLQTSISLFCFIGFVIIGGFKRLVNTMGKLVPFMTITYFLVGFFIIGINIEKIPGVVKLIFTSAFNFTPVAAGALGFSIKQSMRYGVSRGIYSNEAGEGTSAIFYSKVTEGKNSELGLFGIMEVFIDTIVVCSLSGIVALLHIDYLNLSTPTNLMISSFESVHYIFKYFLGLSMALFGTTSILGQWVLGKESLKYITNQFTEGKDFGVYYNVIFLVILFLAPHFSFKTVWYIQDIALGILILPNLLALNKLANRLKFE
ncbi:MAG: sodium:alanine symporter family protein [Fusobacteriaceae bacterium]|nr:sodium:alanine symporter family protein [Fusobacteriaceae bacterium]MBP9509811.1 sodium:alanine symporter family protein [Fusobacteriaceae bacterium]